jgi:hypothetical protein
LIDIKLVATEEISKNKTNKHFIRLTKTLQMKASQRTKRNCWCKLGSKAKVSINLRVKTLHMKAWKRIKNAHANKKKIGKEKLGSLNPCSPMLLASYKVIE